MRGFSRARLTSEVLGFADLADRFRHRIVI